ncbi:MAG: heterodisulfide reductase-related iron-sulfur binding cluster, partial [Thermodesulfobacteriota bacterium]
SFKGLKIATHYGCHVLRPSQVVGFDNPVAPSLFDQLVEVTGAQSIDWSMKLECCGAPLWGVNDELSMDLTVKKLLDGKRSGADYLCVACPYCHLQFDKVQKMILSQRNVNHPLPSILYTQLLGLSLGIDKKILGLEMNEIPIGGIDELLTKEKELTGQAGPTEKTELTKE